MQYLFFLERCLIFTSLAVCALPRKKPMKFLWYPEMLNIFRYFVCSSQDISFTRSHTMTCAMICSSPPHTRHTRLWKSCTNRRANPRVGRILQQRTRQKDDWRNLQTAPGRLSNQGPWIESQNRMDFQSVPHGSTRQSEGHHHGPRPSSTTWASNGALFQSGFFGAPKKSPKRPEGDPWGQKWGLLCQPFRWWFGKLG